MGAKSRDVAIIAPVCCAAAMLNSTRLALQGMCDSAPDDRKDGRLHASLQAMEAALEEALLHVDHFRILYDQHLGD
jgi:hypothetical protein